MAAVRDLVEFTDPPRADRELFRHRDFVAHPERACHGLSRRLAASVDAASVAAAFTASQNRRDAVTGDFTMWTEPVSAPSDAEESIARRARELSRPVDPQRAAGRVLLLTYGDGVRDLIVVAHRAHASLADLRAIIGLLTGAAVPKLPAPASESAPAEAIARQELAWGCGDPTEANQVGHVPIPAAAVSGPQVLEIVLAATGILLARNGGEHPQIALLVSRSGGPHALRRVAGPLGADPSIAEFLAAAARLTPVPPVADGELATVGVVFTESAGDELYVPCSGPVFPLTFVWESGADQRLRGSIAYDRGQISQTAAAQAARAISSLIAELGRGATDRKVADLVYLADAEARQIIEVGRSAARRQRAVATIHELFETIAARQPDAPAVSDDTETLSYRELARRSDQLAAGLRARGIRRGDRVGVCLERSVELVVTMLGILKAGAGYVPMDAHYPQERLAFTTQDAGLSLVVTDAVDFPRAERVELLTPAGVRALAGDDRPADSGTQPKDLAYVIYTSGSTGRPKGVAIPHENVAVLLDATAEEMSLGSGDTWTLFHSSAFDFSVWEIWGCLLSGGHLVVVSHWVTRAPEEFYDLLVARRVTVLSQTPSAFAALQTVDERRRERLALRLVIFGGEALDVRTLAPWFRRHPCSECQLINMFGITETTVHVTRQTVTPVHVQAGSKSVGKALPGWSMSVRDRRGRVQPFGVPGEIYVGGLALASHYLNREDLTAERFIIDAVTGERLYRSGDLGRMHPDGTLDHLGRIDSQVKIRGFRIELDEIRAVLLECPGVGAAAVLVSRGNKADAGSVQIDAYVVLRAGAKLEEIRRRAARYLPDYMVPSSFIPVTHVPMNGNGKLDTKELESQKLAHAQQPAAAEPAATADQGNELLRVWREVMGKQVAMDDDFFEAGGNSLMAVRLLSAIRKLGFDAFSLRDLYKYSSPSASSAFLASGGGVKQANHDARRP